MGKHNSQGNRVLTRHSGESRNPERIAIKNVDLPGDFLDSGLRRNDDAPSLPN